MAALPFLLSALASGLLAVERRAFLQAMASRPLVAGAVIGLCFGRPVEGLALGAMLELFFLGGVNMGAALPDNELFAVVAATSCACTLMAHTTTPAPSALALSALVALPAAKLGRWADQLSDQVNASAAARAQREGPLRQRLGSNLRGLWMPFVSAAAMAPCGGLVGRWLLSPALASSPLELSHALSYAWAALLLCAAAIALHSIRTARSGLFAGLGAAVAVGIQLWRMFAR